MWLSPETWRMVQQAVPIVCIDLLPIRRAQPAGQITHIGLIFRDTPHQGLRWCLVGGRLRLHETILQAVRRQMHETLGDDVRASLAANTPPIMVAEYMVHPRASAMHDPRQHSIGITYLVELCGTPAPQGEALQFRWFELDHLPPADAFGFNQDQIVATFLNTTPQT